LARLIATKLAASYRWRISTGLADGQLVLTIVVSIVTISSKSALVLLLIMPL
jgi:hypothetical protein